MAAAQLTARGYNLNSSPSTEDTLQDWLKMQRRRIEPRPPRAAGGTYAQCDTVVGGQGSVTVSQNDGVWTATLSDVNGLSTPGPSLALAANNGSTALVASGQPVSIQEGGWGPGCSGPPPNDSGLVDDPGPRDTHADHRE
jgi:hypothetical protein